MHRNLLPDVLMLEAQNRTAFTPHNKKSTFSSNMHTQKSVVYLLSKNASAYIFRPFTVNIYGRTEASQLWPRLCLTTWSHDNLFKQHLHSVHTGWEAQSAILSEWCEKYRRPEDTQISAPVTLAIAKLVRYRSIPNSSSPAAPVQFLYVTESGARWSRPIWCNLKARSPTDRLDRLPKLVFKRRRETANEHKKS